MGRVAVVTDVTSCCCCCGLPGTVHAAGGAPAATQLLPVDLWRRSKLVAAFLSSLPMQDYNKPIIIPAWSDSISAITGDEAAATTLDMMKHHFTTHFPQSVRN